MFRISQRIKYYRKKKGMTQEAVANALGVRRENYIKYESGERNPKDERLVQISKIIGVSYNALLFGLESEFADLLNTHVRFSVLGDVDGFYAFYSDVIEDSSFEDIAEFFTLWEEMFKIEAKPFYEKFMEEPSLKTLIDLHDLYKLYYDADVNNQVAPQSDAELETDPELDSETTYRLAFCISMTKYLSSTDFDCILEEAEKLMSGTDLSPLQFFAVKVFVPFLSHIIDAVEMTMNTTIDDFEIYFLHGALSSLDNNEEFDDDGE